MTDDTTAEQKHLPWNTGLSTKPDVDSLLKAFPPETIVPGEWHCTDDEIKQAIGLSDGNRFRTVYSSWVRRLQRDYAVIVYRQELTGFYCPTAEQVFARTHPTLESAGRKIRRQLRGVATVKPQNELHKVVQGHQGRLLHAMSRDLKKARMNALPSTDAKSTPQISPPKRQAQ